MALIWNPSESIQPWISVQADQVWSDGPITATDDLGMLLVTSYEWEIVESQPLIELVVQADSSGVVVSAPNTLANAFQPLDIEYQIEGKTLHCANFNELPAQADEVIRYVPNPSNIKDVILRLTARVGTFDLGSADFIIRVYANYNPGRDALKGAVNARRR
jgi:hypothetical protein